MYASFLSDDYGGGELERTMPPYMDDEALRKLERTVLPSAPIVVIIQIGRWTLNYASDEATLLK